MENTRFKRLGSVLKMPAIAVQLSWLLLAGICGVPAAKGATLIWDGGGADNNWSTANNWDTNGVPANPTLPAAPDIIQFGGATRLNPVVDAGATINTTTWTVDAILFNAGASSFKLTGSAITFQPSNGADHDGRYFLKNNSGTTQTIDNDLIVKAAVPPGTTSGSGIHSGPAGGNLILNGGLILVEVQECDLQADLEPLLLTESFQDLLASLQLMMGQLRFLIIPTRLQVG